MLKFRIIAGLLVLLGGFLGYFIYASETKTDSYFARFPFKLGLDLQGGTHLIYRADLSRLSAEDVDESLEALRDVIERRVNIFGVSEPIVQVEEPQNEAGESVGRLIVELPGVTDVDEATALIGRTPVLDFRTEREEFIESIDEETTLREGEFSFDDVYRPTELTGRHLEDARLEFNQVTGEPIVTLQFTGEGAELFERLTRENLGKTIAIFLDGVPISTPVVQEEIRGGEAQISGITNAEEARELVRRLRAGALPVPISLIQTQNISASLGEEAVERGVRAAIYGLIAVSLFMLLWYRLPGFFAVVSLSFYLVLMLSLFKLIPVTLTAAGIAGFILSLGLAVDANVLIFERLKEELQQEKKLEEAFTESFTRAWASIRDANLTSIFIAIILFWFGTSLIKGFALTFGIGVLVSMFSAIVFTKALLFSLGARTVTPRTQFLLNSGIKR